MEAAFSYFLSLYIRSSMKIRSNEQRNSCSSSSSRLICSSLRNSSIVWSALLRSTSLTLRNCGLRSFMTQQFGDMLISQSVKA